MEEIKFESVTDLYRRLYPALSTKKNEMLKDGIKISELDIWNYLRNNIWNSASNLKLYNMVDDIMNLSADVFKEKGNE